MKSFALWLVPATALVCLFACGGHQDPQISYDHAKQTFRSGDIAAAANEAEIGYRKFHELSADWAWKFRLLHAKALEWQGKDKEAIDLLAQPGPPLDNELTVQKLVLEGSAYSTLRDAAEADSKLGQAELLCKAADLPACADLTSVLGTLQMHRGEFAKAQNYFERYLTLVRARDSHSLEAYAYLNLGWSANEQAHFDEALDWVSAAREISVRENFADMAQSALGNMGWAYYKLGDIEKAEEALPEAEKQAEKLGDTSDQLKWVLALGYISFDRGDLAAAEKAFRQSRDLAQSVKSKEDDVNALQALAFVSEQTKKLDDAQSYADEALKRALADKNKRDQTYPRLVQGRIAAQQHNPVAAEAAYREVEQSPDAPEFLKWEAEHSLARLYQDENHFEAAGQEYRIALSTFEAARAGLQREKSRLPFSTNASHIYDEYIHFLVKQGKTDEALQAAEYNRARTLNEGLGVLKKTSSFQPTALNAPQIARRVGGTILFYCLGEKESYLWLITPQKTTLFSLPPASEIEPAAQRYRKAMTGPYDPLETSNSDGFALYRMLVAPAKALLPKDARVFIIPDGSLNTLNFETLLVPDPAPHYWIDDVTITDAGSLRLLAASRLTDRSTGPLLLLGDPISPGPDFPKLRKASDEMESIKKHFPAEQQTVVAGDKATPQAYLTGTPETYSYIHFVAHGTASRTSPLDSAIVLSKVGAEDDSSKLYARDIIQHRLGADLVTISTCSGAGLRAYSGEGLVGLSWAFLRAGAHNVIGALWEVSDVTTPQLMDDLYLGLKNGQKPDAALRAAKLSLLHSDKAIRKPFYWAPFQLYTGS